MHGHHRVVSAGCDDSEAGNMLVWESQLHAEDICQKAANHGHGHARKQILHCNNFVISGPEIFFKDSRLGVMRLCAHRMASATMEFPAPEGGGLGAVAIEGFELRISHAA